MSRDTEGKGSGCLLAILYSFAVAFGSGAVLLGRLSVLRLIAGNVQDGGMFGIPAVFLGAAAALCFFLIPRTKEASARDKEMQRRREITPEEPWRWNPDWDSGQIEFCQRGVVPFLWGFGLFVIAVVILAGWMFAAQTDPLREWGVTIFLILLLAAGVCLVSVAVWLTLIRRKYGRSSFQMKGMPAFLGERLEGTILAATDLPGGKPLVLALECEKHIPRQDNDYWETMWRSEQRTLHPGGRTIPVCFDLPADKPESRILRDGEGAWINWNLSARLKTPGVNYHSVFEVPVFRRRPA